jgi:hypothetical protein
VKNKKPIKKLNIPKIITEDLTYYMQFGFHRKKEQSTFAKDIKKYGRKPYSNPYNNTL